MMNKSMIMKRAWEIARQGASRFGGNAKEYFSLSLRMAWAEIKEESTMNGTEKQIAWANAIKSELISEIKENGISEYGKNYVNAFIQNVIENSLTDAKWWIENRVDLLHGENGIFELGRKASAEGKTYNQIYAAFLNRLIIEAKKQNSNFPNKK